MKVVVDTSIWSIALRRRSVATSQATELLSELIRSSQAVLLGVIRQELLSGIRHNEQYHRLKNHLRAFPDAKIEAEDYEEAARFSNLCMTKGVQGSLVDFLICGFAVRRDLSIFTSDPDFDHFSAHIPISLLRTR